MCTFVVLLINLKVVLSFLAIKVFDYYISQVISSIICIVKSAILLKDMKLSF